MRTGRLDELCLFPGRTVVPTVPVYHLFAEEHPFRGVRRHGLVADRTSGLVMAINLFFHTAPPFRVNYRTGVRDDQGGKCITGAGLLRTVRGRQGPTHDSFRTYSRFVSNLPSCRTISSLPPFSPTMYMS